MTVSGKHILVIGLGKSGVSATHFLLSKGAHVQIADDRNRNEFGPELAELERKGAVVHLGRSFDISAQSLDWITISPGVPLTHPIVQAAMERHIPIIGELELASRFFDGSIIAITGTNGKTTTTTLLGEFFQKAGIPSFVGGNIGTPMIEILHPHDTNRTAIIEVSSFQLDTIDTFRAHVGILLNITEDHQDRYPDFTAYALSKARVFNRQTETDSAIYNADDPVIKTIRHLICARKLPFTRSKENLSERKEGALLGSTSIKFYLQNKEEEIFYTDIALKGPHNMENVAAAVLAALSEGISIDCIKDVLNQFKGLPHRMTWVDTINGVSFYNDSKATNTDAVKQALRCFTEPVVLIMGGRDKDGDFSVLIPEIQKHVKKIILTGEAAEVIHSAVGQVTDSEIVPDFKEAVRTAYQSATEKEVVLLSPACASFDAFTSYVHRGEVFQDTVRELKKS